MIIVKEIAKLVRPAGALLVSGSPVFNSQPWQLVALAARHALPAIYDQRDYVATGGLVRDRKQCAVVFARRES